MERKCKPSPPTSMRKNMFRMAAISCCIAATSCDYTRIHEYRPERPVQGTLYAAALEFPDGYDWRRDPSGGEVAPSLVFYRDTTVIFRKPTGRETLLQADGDMHRICGCHLFSDCSTDTQTIIFKDGEELFRWNGREMVCDLEVIGNDVYTLALSRSGGGWSYRCNGSIMAGGDYGRLLSGFYRSSHHLCFDYAKAIVNGHPDIPDRHYHVVDGVDSLVVVPADIKKVLASGMSDGQFNYIATISGYDRLIWQAGQKTYVLEEEEIGAHPNCRLVETSDGTVAMTRLAGRDCLWNAEGKKFFTAAGCRIYSICGEPSHLCFAISFGSGLSGMEIYCDGASSVLPANYVMLSPDCLACDDSGFAAGLNDSRDSYRPFILRGKNVLNYDFNGYFICLALP